MEDVLLRTEHSTGKLHVGVKKSPESRLLSFLFLDFGKVELQRRRVSDGELPLAVSLQ